MSIDNDGQHAINVLIYPFVIIGVNHCVSRVTICVFRNYQLIIICCREINMGRECHCTSVMFGDRYCDRMLNLHKLNYSVICIMFAATLSVFYGNFCYIAVLYQSVSCETYIENIIFSIQAFKNYLCLNQEDFIMSIQKKYDEYSIFS